MSRYNHDHDVPFEAFITNLGKYNEGDLVGEWVKFPTTPEELNNVFKRIGIGSTDEFGQPYEEWFITDYDVYVDGIYNILGEYENLDELNFLASRIEELSDYEYSQFEAIIEEGSYSSSVEDLINLTSNLDAFEVMPDVENDYDLGYYYIEEAGIYDLSNMGNLASYIDYERYGRDVALEEGGVFTDKGYVVAGRDSFVIVYDGLESIPEEYKVMNVQIDNEQEKSYTIGEYKVDIQINSDNDFDYTIYKNGKHLDGGILENIHGYDGIPDYAIEEISKMHDLEQHEQDRTVYGYIYDSNGMHGEKIEFDGTPENLANFIMYNKNNAVVITDTMDQFVVSSTQGGFLDRVAYPALREEILEKILPLQLGDKQPIDVAHQDVQRDPIEELARDLDDFAFDYDFYGYQDAIDDRTQHIEMLMSQLQSGNVEDLKDFLKEVIEEGTYMVPEASALLGRVEAIVPPTKEDIIKESKVTFYVAEDIDFNKYGVHFSELQIDQAIDAYKNLSKEKNDTKGIGMCIYNNRTNELKNYCIVKGNELIFNEISMDSSLVNSDFIKNLFSKLEKDIPDLQSQKKSILSELKDNKKIQHHQKMHSKKHDRDWVK